MRPNPTMYVETNNGRTRRRRIRAPERSIGRRSTPNPAELDVSSVVFPLFFSVDICRFSFVGLLVVAVIA